MKFLLFPSVKSVIFTKLRLTTRQKRANIAYKVDTGSEGYVMPF